MSHPSLAAPAAAGEPRQGQSPGLFDRPLGRAGLVGAAVLLVVLSSLAWVVPGLGPWPVAPIEPFSAVVSIGIATLWAVVTLLALSGRDTYRFGWLLILSSAADQIWLLGFFRVDALYFIAENFSGLATVVFAHVLVAFPTGRLRARYDRWLVVALYAYLLGGGIVRSLIWEPGFSCEIYCPRNPFALFPSQPAVAAFDTVTTAVLPFLGIAVVTAVVLHWRAAGPAGRRTLLPVAIAAPIAYVVNTVGYLARHWGDVELLSFIASPIVQATSLVMPLAILTGLLATRLARANVAELAVELGRGVPVGALRDVLARALRDPTVEVAFPAPDGVGLIDPDGRPVAFPEASADRSITRIEHDRELLAVLRHDPAIEREDPGLVGAVASVARLSFQNERLSAQVRAQLEEVRASRVRIVEAADAERRRVERDLHDGAQQRLVALAARLEQAGTTTAAAQGVLEDATTELRAAIAEVRDLARGAHPASRPDGTGVTSAESTR